MKKHWNWTKNEGQNTGHGNEGMQEARLRPASPGSYFGPLSSFYHDIDRMFNQACRHFGLPSVFGNQAGMMFNPSVDISSTDKEYSIEVEIPGMNENDVRLDLTRDGDLCICGEKRQENDKQEKDFHRVERSYGSFSRTLTLPDDADKENVNADFRNGVLTITIPRLESSMSQSRRININSDPSRGEQPNRQEGMRQTQENKPDSNAKRAA